MGGGAATPAGLVSERSAGGRSGLIFQFARPSASTLRTPNSPTRAAGTGMTDLHREVRSRTFERYRTLHQSLLGFVLSKVVFATVLVPQLAV